jgi:hypothetical protein
VSPSQCELSGSDPLRHPPWAVDQFSVDFPDPLAFACAGRTRNVSLTDASSTRRADAIATAKLLIDGGLRDEEVYAAPGQDTFFDLATCGGLRDNVGRPRRRWRGFADQAHAFKNVCSREYTAFCREQGFTHAVQVVVRAPVSIILLQDFRTTHASQSAKLLDKLSYCRKRVAQGFACDLIAAEIRPLNLNGSSLDLHFHLVARADLAACQRMRAFFERAGWTWWDSLTEGTQSAERHPGALAQYVCKSLAGAIHNAGTDQGFSVENLAELFNQTRRIAMARAIGTFRTWKGQLARGGLGVVEGECGQIDIRQRARVPRVARSRERLFTTTGASLLCLTVHDFGNGLLRPAIRVRGRQDISFSEVAQTYDIMGSVIAARRLVPFLESTAIPDSRRSPLLGCDRQRLPEGPSLGRNYS